MKNKKIETLLNTFGQVKDTAFNFDLIEKYFTKKNNSESFQVFSDKTCNDLDFSELFMFIDRTHSRIGQQFLYNKLRVNPQIHSTNQLNESIIEKILNDEKYRVNLQLELEKLNSIDNYYVSTLFQEPQMKPPRWFFLIKMLSFTSFFSLILIFFNKQFLLLSMGLLVVNLVIHYLNKKNLHEYLGSIPQLFKLTKVAQRIANHDENLRQIYPGINQSISKMNKMRWQMSFFRLENSFNGELGSILWSIVELFKILFLLDPLLLYGVLHQLDNKRNEIEQIFAFVGQVDSLISIASLRKGLTSYCIPQINNNQHIIANDIYHPLIENCIPNTIEITDKSILLTGSNMSGKTSFIRTIGINIITGLTINTCFAHSISIPKARLFSAIRISDDLLNDKSYYFEEVITIKEMIEKSQDDVHNIFLLDEIYKGTNTIERIAAGKAVLSYLAKNNIVFVSTHDIELADLLKAEYKLHHFSEIVKDNKVDFDYKLKDGKLKNRNAIRILQINGYPESVVHEAFEISKNLDGNSGLS